MTITHGPSRTNSGVLEIEQLAREFAALRSAVDRALGLLETRITDTLADVPDRLAAVEALLSPMTVDPADIEVEWSYRRGDGILRPAPADPEERLALIASGVPLVPVVRKPRDDGRMVVLPHPEVVAQ